MRYSDDPRVLFAAERTLLAWHRTSLALIALGFVIERSGLLMELLLPTQHSDLSLLLTFWVGLSFMILGAVAAIYAAQQYVKVIQAMQMEARPANYNIYWGVVINAIVALLGFILALMFYLESY